MKPKPKRAKSIWTQAFPEQQRALHPERTLSGGVKAQSGSEKVRTAIYLEIARMFKTLHPFCRSGLFDHDVPNLTNSTTEIHHRLGRSGLLLFDVRNFIPVCARCHRWIHDNPEAAEERGLIAGKGEWNKL